MIVKAFPIIQNDGVLWWLFTCHKRENKEVVYFNSPKEWRRAM